MRPGISTQVFLQQRLHPGLLDARQREDMQKAFILAPYIHILANARKEMGTRAVRAG